MMEMHVYEESIKTIEQAKEYFTIMGCSHFHMMREFPQRYDEYKKLKISEQTEFEWRKGSFYETSSDIRDNTDRSFLWILHSNMYDLYAELRAKEELIEMLEVTKYIRDKVPTRDRVLVAETIIGRTVRKARKGLIYMAYDSGNIMAAKEFAELALHFSSFNSWKLLDRWGRCQVSTQVCQDIKRELGL